MGCGRDEDVRGERDVRHRDNCISEAYVQSNASRIFGKTWIATIVEPTVS